MSSRKLKLRFLPIQILGRLMMILYCWRKSTGSILTWFCSSLSLPFLLIPIKDTYMLEQTFVCKVSRTTLRKESLPNHNPSVPFVIHLKSLRLVVENRENLFNKSSILLKCCVTNYTFLMNNIYQINLFHLLCSLIDIMKYSIQILGRLIMIGNQLKYIK